MATLMKKRAYRPMKIHIQKKRGVVMKSELRVNDFDSVCGISDDNMTHIFRETIRIDNELKGIKGVPVAKYDLGLKKAYLQYPDGRVEYVLLGNLEQN